MKQNVSLLPRTLGLALAAAIALAPGRVLAGPDYSTSTIAPSIPEVPRGDTVRFTVDVRNTGEAATWSQVLTSVPTGAMLVSAGDDGCPARIDREQGDIVLWEKGGLASGAVLTCPVTLLAVGSEGSNISLQVRVLDATTPYHLSGTSTIGTRPAVSYPLAGRLRVSRAGLVVLAFPLAFLLLLPLLVLVARARTGKLPVVRIAGGLFLVLVATGFLTIFAFLALDDRRVLADYREADCEVLDSHIAFESERGRSGPNPARQRGSFKPLVAVRFRAAGREVVAAGFDSGSHLSSGASKKARELLQRYPPGSRCPCYYDPDDPSKVVLVRGPGGAYVFALLPLPVLAAGLLALRSALRK